MKLGELVSELTQAKGPLPFYQLLNKSQYSTEFNLFKQETRD